MHRVSWQTTASTVCPVGGRSVVIGKSGSFFFTQMKMKLGMVCQKVEKQERDDSYKVKGKYTPQHFFGIQFL